MYSFFRRRFGIDKEVFQLKIHLFYIKRNETGEIYDPPVLYALTDEKKTSDSFREQRKKNLFIHDTIEISRKNYSDFMSKMNKNKILTMTKLEMSDGRKISCTLTWEEEKNVVIFHRSSYFEALKNKSINPKYFSEEAYKILDMIEYREIYDAGSLLQLGMYADLYDYNIILDQFKLMYRLYGWTFKDA